MPPIVYLPSAATPRLTITEDRLRDIKSVSVSRFSETTVTILFKDGGSQTLQANSFREARTLLWRLAYLAGLSPDQTERHVTTRWVRR